MRIDSHKTDTFIALSWGVLLSFVVRGYQFGRGNHHVYLLEPLRINDPALLTHDWWTTHTLQYHWLFSYFAAAVMRLGIERPAFFVAHLATVVLLHLAWWRIVRTLRGDLPVYVVSVLLYHTMAGGFGLGFYVFLQDSAFLPSNAAAVALLWGIAYWLVRRDIAAGVCVGIAGVWHLNYAVVGVGAWGIYLVWRLFFTRGERTEWKKLTLATAAVLVPCIANIVPALIAKTQTEDLRIPLQEYVDLYVRLRHPHHYNPASWPIALWVAVLLPVPMAWRAWSVRPKSVPLRRAVALVLAVAAVLLVTLVGAGIFWFSGTLIQMSLWRFSVFPKLLTCIGAAMWITWAVRSPTAAARGEKYLALAVAIGIPLGGALCWLGGLIPADQSHSVMVVLACVVAGVPLAMRRYAFAVPGVALMVVGLAWNGTAAEPMDAGLRDIAGWAQEHTPVEAVFEVPPGDSGFRFESHRAAVVSFKHVPQLSGEMRTWRDALQDVLAVDDITTVPGNFPQKLAWIDEHYRQRPLGELLAVAAKHGADYLIAPPVADRRPRYVSGDGRWAVYVVDTDDRSDPE